jgi:hypothetical protein
MDDLSHGIHVVIFIRFVEVSRVSSLPSNHVVSE